MFHYVVLKDKRYGVDHVLIDHCYRNITIAQYCRKYMNDLIKISGSYELDKRYKFYVKSFKKRKPINDCCFLEIYNNRTIFGIWRPLYLSENTGEGEYAAPCNMGIIMAK